MAETMEVKKTVDALKNNKDNIFESWIYLFNNFFEDSDIDFQKQWFDTLFKAIIHAVRGEIDYSLLNFSLRDIWKQQYEFLSAEQIQVEKFINLVGACLARIEPYLQVDDNRKIWHLKNYISYSLMLSSYDDILSALKYKGCALEDLGAIILFLDIDMNVLWKSNNVDKFFPKIEIGKRCNIDFINQDKEYHEDKKYHIKSKNNENISYTVRRINGYFMICGQNIDDIGVSEEELYSVKSKLQFVLDSYPVPMMILSKDGTILRYGKTFRDLMKKYDVFQEKFLNKKFSEIDLFSNNKLLYIAMKDYLKNDKNFETTLVCENGCEFFFTANNIYDIRNHDVIGYIVVLHELDNYAHLNKKCDIYAKICKSTLDMLDGFAVIVDKNYNVLFSNDLAEQLLNSHDNLKNIDHALMESVFCIIEENDFTNQSKQEVIEFNKSKEIQINIKKIEQGNLFIQLQGIHFMVAELKENLLKAQKNWDILEKELKNKHIGGK